MHCNVLIHLVCMVIYPQFLKEEAFRNFVGSHDNYLRYEDDEEKMALMTDSYDSQRDMKLQLDILVSEWRKKRRREERPPSESRFSHTAARS